MVYLFGINYQKNSVFLIFGSPSKCLFRHLPKVKSGLNGFFPFHIFVVWQKQLAKRTFKDLVLALSMNIFKKIANI